MLEFENEEEMKKGLKEFLMVNNGIDELNAERDADAMVDKSRLVYDGEYAMLI